MARYAFGVPPLNFSNSSADLTTVLENNAQQMRDYFRDGDGNAFGIMNEALPAKYKVSDIGTWGSTYQEGYAFIVRDTNAGCEWMFAFSGEESNDNNAEMNDWWDDDQSHYQPVEDTPVNTGGTGSGISEAMLVYFNPDYATDSFITPFGFDNTTELTYSGGDFTTVTTNPNVDFSEWLPSGVLYPKGFLFTPSATGAEGAYVRVDMVWDDTYDMLAIYWCEGKEAGGRPTKIALLGGEYCIPNVGGDTNLMGGVWIQLEETPSRIGQTSHAYGQGFDDAGARIYDYDLDWSQSYTPGNELNASDEYKWRAVGLVSASNDKGHVHTDLLREIGAYQSWVSYGLRFNAPSATEPMVKVTDTVATMWADQLPAPPVAIPALPSNND